MLNGIPVSELRLIVHSVVFTLLFLSLMVASGFLGYASLKLKNPKEKEHLRKLKEKAQSDELAKNASEGIGKEDVLILKNHGVICVSESLKEAELLAVFVEETAKTQFITYLLNSVEDI